MSLEPRHVGIYIHIPFCAKKCGYCDFNAYSGYKDGTKARYVDALCAEIAARSAPWHAPTVFLGGGTPTALSAEALIRILDQVRQSFTVGEEAEIGLEANPSDASPTYLARLRDAGFNRLSFGVQTFNDRLLLLIDRTHTGADARRAIALARDAGFVNLSVDLMFGLPRQTTADWDRTLEAALALQVPHLSLYGLIVEPGTPFWGRRARGKLPLPDENAEAAMYGRALERTAAAGYRRYEISNHALPGFACRHNRTYWENREYLGFGAGATGYLDRVRATNVARPSAYIDAVAARGWPVVQSERLTEEETMGETMMLGLRLAEGVDLAAFATRFGVRAETRWSEEIARLRHQGLVEIQEGRLRLTEPQGVFLASEAMMAFV